MGLCFPRHHVLSQYGSLASEQHYHAFIMQFFTLHESQILIFFVKLLIT